MPTVPEAASNCQRCGEPYADHDKERVTHDEGGYSYNYVCPGVGA
jgi:hypothetical protein